jgi:hypothetical protein
VQIPNAYSEYLKYSPFYLKHHPEARAQGDIADIRHMSENSDIKGIEDVFEKNAGNFENLMTRSDEKQALMQA